MQYTSSSGFPDQKICIVGLGYVGLTLAIAMSEVGFLVHGLEVNETVLACLRQGKPHFWEQGLAEKLERAIEEKTFTFSRDVSELPHQPSVYIITVGTPLNAEGKARIDMVQTAAGQVATCLQDDDLIILRSTVKVGTSRQIVQPILDATGKRYDIAVCPERTLEGRALQELRELPQVIGADTTETTLRAAHIFNRLTPTTIRVSTLETAETIKLVDNTFRDISFAFGNEIARFCDAAGIRASEVIKAGKFGYARTNVAMPGLVGGPCLGKDPHILSQSAAEAGIQLEITQAARLINERQPAEVVGFLRGFSQALPDFPAAPSIVLMGLSFKGQPATDDLRGTMARPVFDALKEAFPTARFSGFDFQLTPEAITEFGLEPKASLDEALAGANIALILNNHQGFITMPIQNKAALLARPGFFYDFWNLHSGQPLNMPVGTGYIALGSHRNALFNHNREVMTR